MQFSCLSNVLILNLPMVNLIKINEARTMNIKFILLFKLFVSVCTPIFKIFLSLPILN